jgi:hypothetical protein
MYKEEAKEADIRKNSTALSGCALALLGAFIMKIRLANIKYDGRL